jgi:hypothetical protein
MNWVLIASVLLVVIVIACYFLKKRVCKYDLFKDDFKDINFS